MEMPTSAPYVSAAKERNVYGVFRKGLIAFAATHRSLRIAAPKQPYSKGILAAIRTSNLQEALSRCSRVAVCVSWRAHVWRRLWVTISQKSVDEKILPFVSLLRQKKKRKTCKAFGW